MNCPQHEIESQIEISRSAFEEMVWIKYCSYCNKQDSLINPLEKMERNVLLKRDGTIYENEYIRNLWEGWHMCCMIYAGPKK